MKNRRSLERMPLFLDVTVSDVSDNRYHYSIENFSLGGLLLKCCESGGETRIPLFSKGDFINVHFDLSFDSRQEQFTQCVKVIWTERENMGVAFYSDSLALLEAYFLSVNKRAGESENGSAQGGVPRSEEEVFNISAQCKTIALSMLRDIYRKYATRVRDNLFSAAKRARDMQSEGELLDVIALLNTTGEQHRDRLVGAVGELFDVRGAKKALLDKFVFSDRGELSLVENTEYEHYIIVREMIKRLNTKFYSLLNPLESRFNHLYGDQDHQHDTNPVSPDIICHLFSKELQDIGLSQEPNSILYLSFEETLFEQMSELYMALNKVLAGNDVLPDLEMRSAEDKLMDSFMNFFRSSRAMPGQSTEKAATKVDPDSRVGNSKASKWEEHVGIPDSFVDQLVNRYSSNSAGVSDAGSLFDLLEEKPLKSSSYSVAVQLKLNYFAGAVEGIVSSTIRNPSVDQEKRSLISRLKLPMFIHVVSEARQGNTNQHAAINGAMKLCLILMESDRGLEALEKTIAEECSRDGKNRDIVKALLTKLEA